MDTTIQEQPITSGEQINTENIPETHTNIYPIFRTFFLFIFVFIVVAIVLFLIYQNGKSIYEHGI